MSMKPRDEAALILDEMQRIADKARTALNQGPWPEDQPKTPGRVGMLLLLDLLDLGVQVGRKGLAEGKFD